MDTDWGAVRWIVPLRAALVCAVTVGIAMVMGWTHAVVPLAVGALLAGAGDMRGTVAARAKGIAWTTVWVSVATVLGILASDWAWVRVAASVAVAFVCGYVGRMGPRASLVGTVSLVTFVIFAGAPLQPSTALVAGPLVLLGGLIQLVAAILPQLLMRTGGVRGDMCVAYRAVGHSLRASRIRYGASSPVLKVERARAMVDAMHADPSVRAPFEALLDALTRLRIGGLMLVAIPRDDAEADEARVRAFTDASAKLVIEIGRAHV